MPWDFCDNISVDSKAILSLPATCSGPQKTLVSTLFLAWRMHTPRPAAVRASHSRGRKCTSILPSPFKPWRVPPLPLRPSFSMRLLRTLRSHTIHSINNPRITTGMPWTLRSGIQGQPNRGRPEFSTLKHAAFSIKQQISGPCPVTDLAWQ